MKQKKAINVEIGANIQKAREAADLTQEQLSEMIDITPNHLSAIERGVSGASLETLRNISVTLLVSIDSLFFGNDASSEDIKHLSIKMARLSPKQRNKINSIFSDIINLLPEE